MGDLSAGESAIYDRQIRLWGSSAQMRIKSSTVLLLGVTSTTVEIVKNIVLAGASLIIADDRSVDDSTSNFLIKLELDDLAGLSVGKATSIAAHRLNEHPAISCMRESEVGLESTMASISALIVSLASIDFNADRAKALSLECRKQGVAFFLVMDSREVSWMFSDFGKKHIVDSHTAPLKRDERTGERSALKTIEEFQFVDLEEYIASDLDAKLLKTKSSYPLKEVLFMKFFLEWMSKEKHGKDEERSPKRTRLQTFPEFVEKHLEDKFSGSRKDELVEAIRHMQERVRLDQGALPHIAAIHGALVSQEVVKFITKRDPPLVNQIVINPIDCGAVTVKTPATLSSQVIGGDSKEEDDVELVFTASDSNLDILD